MALPTLVLATRNPHKLIELRRCLRGVRVRAVTLEAYPTIPAVREDGATFEANALKKAVQPSRRVPPDVLVVAEDSGLVVDALRGAPGIRTARYARAARGEDRDAANNAKLLRALRGVPTARRGAAFVCVVALARGGRALGTIRAECRGRIAETLRGTAGFGYDPLFIPRGPRGSRGHRTFAEHGPRVKDRWSHRARAMRRARPLIAAALRAARRSV